MKKLLSIIISLLVMVSSLSIFACDKGANALGKVNPIYYTVSVENTDGGTVTANKSSVELGESVSFSVSANDGYVLEGLYLNGGKADVVDNAFTVESVLRNYQVKGVFAKEQVEISFEGEGTSSFSNMLLNFGDTYNNLPTPIASGKHFLGWQNEDGVTITEFHKVDAIDGDITLTAVYGDIDESQSALHVPFSITTSYYNQEATEYGVAWHTNAIPVTPVILLAEGDTSDFTNATLFTTNVLRWKTNMYGDEYIASGVIDGLDFDTTYSVKFGDYTMNAWSDVYTFTTRKEVIEDFGFIYITDTQEHVHFGGEYSPAKYVLNDATARFPEAEFIAHGGDIVQNGTFPCAWEDMLLNFDEVHFTYPVMPTTGNHERSVYGVSAEPNNVNVNYNIDYPGKETGEDLGYGVYYSFDYGNLHFVTMSSNDIYRDGRDIDELQLAWVRADVAAARQNPETKWVIVMIHHAIFPTLPYETDQYYTPQLMKLLDELDIDLLLYGHGHAVSSSYPLVWDDTADREVNYTKVRQITREIEKVTFDGDVVDKFVYPENITDYGTVLHQTGSANSQTNEGYASLSLDNLPSWRALWGGKRNPASEIAVVNDLAMYSYVDVTDDAIVVRTYGVDSATAKTLTSADDVLSTGFYLDGFMISR